MNDTSEHTIVPLSIHDLDFTDLSLKGLRLELLKNVEATQIQLSNIWFDKQRNINVNTTRGIRISGVFGMKDFSFIKHYLFNSLYLFIFIVEVFSNSPSFISRSFIAL